MPRVVRVAVALGLGIVDALRFRAEPAEPVIDIVRDLARVVGFRALVTVKPVRVRVARQCCAAAVFIRQRSHHVGKVVGVIRAQSVALLHVVAVAVSVVVIRSLKRAALRHRIQTFQRVVCVCRVHPLCVVDGDFQQPRDGSQGCCCFMKPLIIFYIKVHDSVCNIKVNTTHKTLSQNH